MSRSHALLAILASALGVGAGASAVAGGRPASLDVPALSLLVAAEQDHVSAIDLARWLRHRRPGLRIIDLRTEAEFEAGRIPQAERVAIESLHRLRLSPTETIVLYSEGGAHSAQAWVFLRALGYGNVYFLRGGYHEWLDDVLYPALPVDATDVERERFRRSAELSDYFGGQPTTGVPRQQRDEAIRQARRRGC